MSEHRGICIGGCGRTTNGWFRDGDLGPGWYCGWCGPVPGPNPDRDHRQDSGDQG